MSEKNVWDILNRNLFFVKNVVAKREAKTSDKFDVYDPESLQILLECREPDIGILTKTPGYVVVATTEDLRLIWWQAFLAATSGCFVLLAAMQLCLLVVQL